MRQLQTWSAVAALGASAAILAVVGCQSGSKDEGPKETGGGLVVGGAAEPAKAEPAEVRLLPDLPEKNLAGVLAISGQMIGYLEPCGCSEKQKGGLVRRATLVHLMEDHGWDVGLIDLGTIAEPSARARGGPQQSKLKFDAAMRALKLLDYDGIALSVDDLRPPMTTAETLMQMLNTLPESADGLKVLAANVRPIEGLDFEKFLRPSLRREVGGVKVGITAVLSPEEFAGLNDADKSTFLTVTPPEESLPGVLADLEKDTALQMLMVQGPPELAAELAKQYPGFEVVIGTSTAPDPPAQPELLNDGKTRLVTVGKKGMYLGLLGVYKGDPPTLEYRRVVLDDRLDKMAKQHGDGMARLIGEDLQATYRAANLLETYPKRPYALFEAPSDATFIGAQACRECHPNTFAKWAATKHSHAYEPLVSDPRHDGRNREADPSCVSCHTTGFEYVGGFVTADATPNLKANQCENCHGPGSKHAEEPDNELFRKSVARNKEFFRDSIDYGCVRCHDEDNDPHYKFDEYWPQVAHEKLDTYDAPKVHQGLDLSKTIGSPAGN